MSTGKSILFTLLLFAGTINAQDKFYIIGTADPALDGKKLYLSNKYTDYSKTENPIFDSCVVKDGKFYFTGSLKNPASYVSLYLARPAIGIKQLFIENRRITINIQKSKNANILDNCLLENTPVENQQQELTLAKSDYTKRFIALSEKEQKEYTNANDSLKAAMNNEMRRLMKEETSIIINFIKQHPDYYASLFWFCYHVTDRTITQPDTSLLIFKQLSPRLQQLPEGQKVLQRIMNKLSLVQNKMLPYFSIPDTSGHIISAANFKGNYLLIDFWASWCGPCIDEIPNVKKLAATYSNKNLSLISISLDDDKTRWVTAVKKYALSWTQVSELKGWQSTFSKQLDIRYIPQYFLVDPEGKFVLMEASLNAVEEYLKKIN